MKFRYVFRHYLVGFILFLFISTSGALAIKEAFFKFPVIYLAYTIVCCIMLYGYMSEYYRYKDKAVFIYKEGMIVSDRDTLVTINLFDIDCIIEANHRQRMKMHNIVHVFLIDGRYLFFNDQIAHYPRFKMTLQEVYKDRYYKREGLFSEELEVTKENLLNE